MRRGHQDRPRSRRATAALVALAVVVPLGSIAEARGASLFSTQAPAAADAVANGSPADGSAHPLDSRIARVDLEELGAVRESVAAGRSARMRLNLFRDAEFEAVIERSAPTANGYSLSGPLPGVPFGRVVLVVNGDHTVGRVYTPESIYAIRTTGRYQTVERFAPEPLHCETVTPLAVSAASNGGTATRDPVPLDGKVSELKPGQTDEPLARRSGRAGAGGGGAMSGAAAATDDGDVVDVLVVYPSFVREIEGGYEVMLAQIDLDLATANEIYAASGVELRVELAAAVEVEYDRFLNGRTTSEVGIIDTRLWREAIEHLTAPDDGHLDEVHALRDRHAADLVLLHLGGEGYQVVGRHLIGGIAWALSEVSGEVQERRGFSVARSGGGTNVAHELGHGMGLRHDRYDVQGSGPFPYSHGYRYRYPDPRYESWDGTVMSNYRTYRGLPVFSNPDLIHPDWPELRLGVPGEEPSSGVDGPANAVRHLNEVGGIVANVRARADADPCRYALSGEAGKLPSEGGTYRVRVETGDDCAWSASAGEWVASVSPASGAGSGEIEVEVAANGGWQRPLEVMVSGQVHARRQAGSRSITPVCERSGEVRGQLVVTHPDKYPGGGISRSCPELTFDADYLASVRTLYHPVSKRPDVRDVDPVKAPDMRRGDFDGLTGLVRLELGEVVRVPADVFSGLIGLRYLEFSPYSRDVNTLTNIEPGAFRGLPGLRRLHIFGHRIGRFEPGTFAGMPRLLLLWIVGNYYYLDPEDFTPVTRIEPGAFSGLSELRNLGFWDHRTARLEAGAFDGLDRLYHLHLPSNELERVMPGAFDGLHELSRLDLWGNRLETLSPGTFAGLTSLENLTLEDNRLTRLPVGVFDGLTNLKDLALHSNRLTTLEPGTFAGLSKLKRLIFDRNQLRNLPPGAFEGLESLTYLSLMFNPIGPLRAGVFDGLDRLHTLFFWDAAVTSLQPGVFDHTPDLDVLDLENSRLRKIAPGTFTGLNLSRLHLGGNPGAPFAFTPTVVSLPPSDPGVGQPAELAVEVVPAAPFTVLAELDASGGAIRARQVFVHEGQGRSSTFAVYPDTDAPVTVRVDRARWRGENAQGSSRCGGGSGGITFCVIDRNNYSGFRVAPGPPVTVYGLPDVELTRGHGEAAIDLAAVFSYFVGADADYAVVSSDPAVAAVRVADGELVVTPLTAGSATITVTATGVDGESRERRFAVTVRVPMVPLFLPGSEPGREGFVRLINRSGKAGDVEIVAIDDAGRRRGPVPLRLRANAVVHFNSNDLEDGNAAKGLAEGVGAGDGGWRLEFKSTLDIEALAYVRTEDGFLTSMHDLAPLTENGHRVAIFNPASNPDQASRLRVINPGGETAAVTVRGIDDAGASPGGEVRFTVPAGAARTFTAAQLESGDHGLDGALGDGEGKWRLVVESDTRIRVMSLLENAATGHLTNLSSVPGRPGGDGVHHVPLFPSASDPRGRQGFARVINRSAREGTVRIEAYDDAGERYGPLELALGAGAAAHFNSEDLELGNAAKGLAGSTGSGEGGWRLELTSDLDIEALSYVRTADGFLTAMHDAAALSDRRYRVGMFNPGGNPNQVSRLRLVNPAGEPVLVTVVATDDVGQAPTRKGSARVTVPAGSAVTLSSAELEAGVESGVEYPYDWEHNALGDGAGKWRLVVTSDTPVVVMSLLESPTGHLTNLSASPAYRVDEVSD